MKLHLRLEDDFIDKDQIFGPLPNFNTTFEGFFLQKSIELLFNSKNGPCENNAANNSKFIVIINKKTLKSDVLN
jgi:hypothetical protein